MSSAADPTAAFLAALQASRLLAPQQVQQLTAWVAQTRADVPALAKEVNRLGWLTPFQIKEIFKGRGKDLFLGQYVLLDLLGEGGMGRVFKVHNTRLGRDEALKVIRHEKLKHPAAEARFQAEMQALGKVKHPNVVTAYDADAIGDTHFVSMEFIDGADLTRLVRERGPLPVLAACEYIRQGALGLQHAHELGMVHRDIKPSNLLVTRDGRTVKLVDLGLARLAEPATEGANRITQEGFVIGTPDFLAPEQARNPGAVDIRADIYALGATLFYILTGKVPYEGANPTEKLLKHCTEPPPWLLPLRPDAPPQVEQIIHWCMAKQPQDRPQTPKQLALALQPFCPAVAPGGQPPVAPHPAVVIHGPGVLPPPQPLPAADPAPSSQVFKLPPRSNDDDPIRARARARFPTGLLFIGLGTLLVLGILGFAAYRVFRTDEEPPIEPFENSVGMQMVVIPAGTFKMGSPDSEPGRSPDEGPVHEVSIRGPFFMSVTEVTHDQYVKVMDTAPSQSVQYARNAAELPVDAVTYEHAVEFCRKLTERERREKRLRKGWAYRLPTEAEWEYACRAGSDTPFANGSVLRHHARDPKQTQARYTPTGEAADAALEGPSVPPERVYLIPTPVRSYPPNAWGLYDMHGNVAEWCSDWYGRDYYATSPVDNPTGPESGTRRVVRGGSFRDRAADCRSTARRAVEPTYRGLSKDDPVYGAVGFRVVYAPVNQ